MGTVYRFGDFKVLDLIGRGGMARVYRAVRYGKGDFRTIVALKVIMPEPGNRDAITRYFRDEARLGRYLHHPNIVSVLDFGEVKQHPFMVMEYINGTSLSVLHKALRQRGERLPPAVALNIMLRLCRGLDYAHKALDGRGRPLNVVHRDIKPSNILLGINGEVKLCDFGVARASTQEQGTKGPGTPKGTISYFSPEQALLMQLDHRSDLFTMGSVLFELLTGCQLYDGGSEMMQYRQAMEAKIEHRLALIPDIPARATIVELLTQCLHFLPERRHDSALLSLRDVQGTEVTQRLSVHTGDTWICRVSAEDKSIECLLDE